MLILQFFFCIRFSIYNKFFHIPSCSEKWQTIIPNCKSSKNLCSSSNVNYLYILPSNEQNFLIGLQITSLEVMFRDVCFFNMWSLKGGGIWLTVGWNLREIKYNIGNSQETAVFHYILYFFRFLDQYLYRSHNSYSSRQLTYECIMI